MAKRLFGTYWLAGLVFLLFVIEFRAGFSPELVLLLAKQTATTGFLVAGAAVMMVGGDLDFSIASQTAMATLVYAYVANSMPAVAAGLAAVFVNMAFGAVKGWLVARMDVPPLVITIGLQMVLSGLLSFATADKLILIGGAGLLPYSAVFYAIVFLAFVGCVAAVSIFFNHTYLGRHCVAIGENRAVVQNSRVNVTRQKVFIHMFASVFIALGGILLAVQAGAGSAAMGSTTLYGCIAALCIGRISLLGGKGGAAGVVVGSLGITMLTMAMARGRLPGTVLTVLEGAIILVTLTADILHARKPASARAENN